MNVIRVLAIEDDPNGLSPIRRALKVREGKAFEVTATERLSSGLEALGSSDQYDAVLLDMHLPDPSALANLKRVVEAAPDIAVIVISGDVDETLALEAIRRGADDFLFKSEIGGGILPRAIHYAIERRARDRAHFAQRHEPLNNRLSSALHELNNLIFTISGNVDLLEIGEKDSRSQISRYERIRNALRRMTKTAGDLQSVTVREHAHTSRVRKPSSSLPATSA